jgi:hypothetical protein
MGLSLPGISPDVWAGIAQTEEMLFLERILQQPRYPPRLRNTPEWRSYNAAVTCAVQLMNQTPEDKRAHLIITTCCKTSETTKAANKKLSKIIEKHLAIYTTGSVRFLHRTKRGYVHWHIVAAMREPILSSSAPDAQTRSFYRMMHSAGLGRDSTRDGWLTDIAGKIRRRLSRACGDTGIGYKVDVAAVDNPQNLVNYLARYLRGIAESGRRYKADKGVRLWAPSKSAQLAKVSQYILTDGGRLHRMKLQAFAFSKGCISMEDARKKLGSKWAYHARPDLNKIRLRRYPREEDFISEWGADWSPEALGIQILDSGYSASNRKYRYSHDIVHDHEREHVAALLRSVVDPTASIPPSLSRTPKSSVA